MKIVKNRLIMVKEKELEFDSLKTCDSVYDFLTNKLELHKEPEEVVVMLALDNKLNIVSYCDVARGDISKTLLNPREIYKRALVSNAKSIIIAHNHPCGDVTPSSEDNFITRIIRDAGEIVGVRLIDHIIIGDKEYYSFFENNPNLVDKYEANRYYETLDVGKKEIKNKKNRKKEMKERNY